MCSKHQHIYEQNNDARDWLKHQIQICEWPLSWTKEGEKLFINGVNGK